MVKSMTLVSGSMALVTACRHATRKEVESLHVETITTMRQRERLPGNGIGILNLKAHPQ